MDLRTHTITLQGSKVILRPMTEGDWPVLAKWNADPEVLYFAEGDNVSSYTLEQIQEIYSNLSQTAYCFIAELDYKPVGECWLQEMNLTRIRERYANLDCRRIDLMIGEKSLWGMGIGSEIIALLTSFAFLKEGADIVFGFVADYNPRSMRAFQKAGYQVIEKIRQPDGMKALFCYDLALTKAEYMQSIQVKKGIG